MPPFSLDLRQRVLNAALDGTATEQEVAARFDVSKGFVQKIKRRWRKHDTVAPVGHRGGAPRKLSDDDRAALAAWADGSDATAAEFAARLADERGVAVSARTVNRLLREADITRKKRASVPPNATATT